jgi:[CysO sulfur-carrier protein]-S-L-cysteine hydrolase
LCCHYNYELRREVQGALDTAHPEAPRVMPPFTLLTLPDLFAAEVIDHAHAELPYECCGLLAGVVRDGVGVVCARYPIWNDAASPTEFLSNPEDMLRAHRSMRERGLELLAIYHSHPGAAPVPSRRDLEKNTYGDSVVHLIVGLGGPAPEVRGWWFRRGEVLPAALSSA